MVRDYLWSGRGDGRTRAKISWDKAMLPIIHGGIKMINPHLQAQALLAKFMTRGLQDGEEPWRVLLKHRISNIRPAAGQQWPPGYNWLMSAQCIKTQGSSLWEALWQAWRTIRRGTNHEQPLTKDEILRQSLFGNPWITTEDGIPIGFEDKSRFMNWAEKGITTITDIWDEAEEDWRTTRDIHMIMKSILTNIQRMQLLSSIPKRPDEATPFGTGSWITHVEEEWGGNLYHIHRAQHPDIQAHVYTRNPQTRELTLIANEPIPIPIVQYRTARVYQMIGGDIIKFNPKKPDETIWTYGTGRTQDLEWDPGEWRKAGNMHAINFFSYTTKRGYRLGLNEHGKPTNFELQMRDKRYNADRRKEIYKNLWLPRQVTTFMWLVLTGGLPLGTWLAQIGHTGICQLCTTEPTKTTEHAFLKCEATQTTWSNYNDLCLRHNQPRLIANEEGILLGYWTNIEEEDDKWNFTSNYEVTKNTPWDLLRCNLLWQIWCQRCAKVRKGKTFHLGTA
jgi:hypothetical protein